MWFSRNKNNKKRVFLDFASITPLDKRVQDEMQKYSGNMYANPSALYEEALAAKEVLNDSRNKIAEILNCRPNEIIFTSGGTEANNLALLGIFESLKTDKFIPHFVTTVIEHSSVLEACKEIERRGGEVTYIPVSFEGLINPKDVNLSIKKNTVLISIMYANNEIGVIEPIKEISKKIRAYKNKEGKEYPYFHVDACQAAQYLDLDVLKLGVDMLTLDGIKMYGPRGAGLLYVKNNINLKPVIFGGGQEKGLRSGTENISNAAGLATALQIADDLREKEAERLTRIRDYGIEKILKNFPGSSLNGSMADRLPNNINICFPGLDAEFAVISLDVGGISASYSSSCMTLKEDSSSYVVESLGKKDCKESSLRFTLGRESKMEDMDRLVTALEAIVLK